MQKLSIITNRSIIRDLVITDFKYFHQYLSNPEVTKYQGFDVMIKAACADFIHAQANKKFGVPGQWISYALLKREWNQ